ncbi:hypothetical protein HS7_11350 [Sulfolobales archaeon HS-7]|nr:hypothetical protein HS7_11350 [Sulfolobales archaeon HS-7]
MTWKCTVCGYENDEADTACISCGTLRDAVSVQQTPIQQTQTPEQVQPQVTPNQEGMEQNTNVPQNPGDVQQQVQKQDNPVIQVQQQPTSQGKFYLLFVNTPATSLLKQKVPLDFEDFPQISLGRSPENVVVIPDSEVSRRHAVLTLEGENVMFEDLNSTNGSYVYDGKVFQQVKNKVKLEVNTLIKLGNSTIVKLVRE